MSTTRSILGALLAAGLASSGCGGQMNRPMVHDQAEPSPPAAARKVSVHPGDNHRQTDGSLKPEHWPRTVDQAVDLLVARLSVDFKREIRSTPRDDLDKYHNGFGDGIRNDFGLWADNDDLLRDCALRHPDYVQAMEEHPSALVLSLKSFKDLKENTTGPPVEVIIVMPDDASGIIIEALWERLQQGSEQPRQQRSKPRRATQEWTETKIAAASSGSDTRTTCEQGLSPI